MVISNKITKKSLISIGNYVHGPPPGGLGSHFVSDQFSVMVCLVCGHLANVSSVVKISFSFYVNSVICVLFWCSIYNGN